MKRINRDGPPILGGFPRPARGDRAALERALGSGAAVIDTRPADVFAEGHVPGTINIPLNKSFSTWAGWLVKYDVDIHLVADDAPAVARAVRELAMIGLDRVTAWYESSVVVGWLSSGRPVGIVARTDVPTLAPRLARGEVTVIDVRSRSEWEEGHLPGALHIPAGHLPSRLAEIPRDKPIIVQCQTGARSAIATSVLQKLGVGNATDLRGGFAAWQEAGYEVVRDAVPLEV